MDNKIIIVSSNSSGGWVHSFDSIDVNGMTIREGERNNQKRLETQATTQHAILAANGSGPPWTSSRVSTPAVWPAVQRSWGLPHLCGNQIRAPHAVDAMLSP